MGLDMHCYSFPTEMLDDITEGNLVDFNVTKEQWNNPGFKDFWYWRKFNALHGWMRDLYYKKGGTSEDFNCDNVLLSLVDLIKLAVEINDLKPTEGFFFGSQQIYPEDIEDLKEFIKAAAEEIENGRCVFYTSWW